MLDEFLDVGATKFVLFPFAEPDNWIAEIKTVAQVALPRQT